MANPTTNFGWVMPTSADLVTDLPADFNIFGQGVDTSMVGLLGGTTGQVLSKTSGTNMAFTWVTTDDANAIQNSIMDAKGDLIGATANDTPARLAVGTNNQVLTADSAEATGLKWATPASGGGMTLLQTVTLSGSSVTTSSLSGSHKSLVCYFFGVTVSSASGVAVRVNSNTGNNYGDAYLSDSNTTFSINAAASSFRMIDYIPTTPGDAQGKLEIPQYANAAVTVKHAFVSQSNDVARRMINSAYIKESAAITTLTFATLSAATFGGTIQVYGVS